MKVVFGPGGSSLLEAAWKLRVAAGLALLVAGVLIALFPELLVLLMASVVAAAGLSLLGSGLRARRRLRGASRPDHDSLWR